MKFRILMKDPDGVSEAIKDAAEESLDSSGLSGAEKENLLEFRIEQINQSIRKWFEYSEYLDVEIDTDAGTCVVIPNK